MEFGSADKGHRIDGISIGERSRPRELPKPSPTFDYSAVQKQLYRQCGSIGVTSP
jgi:hypothetical protein